MVVGWEGGVGGADRDCFCPVCPCLLFNGEGGVRERGLN